MIQNPRGAKISNPKLDTGGPARGRRNRNACTSCRQVKLSCDSAQKFPSPCSRCQNHKLRCQIDPSFKRTRARDHLAEVKSQLQGIQKGLETLPAIHEPHTPSSWTSPTAESRGGHDSFYIINRHDASTSSFTLGPAVLTYDTIVELFEHFHRYYARHCPIFTDDESITHLHHSAPILFWTIVITSSRWHSTFPDVYHELVGPYQEILGKTLVAPMLSLAPIQALALLCIWPLAVQRQSHDPTWNYCGLLINAAVKMGIHVDARGRNPHLSRVKLKTWMACFLANSSNPWHSGKDIDAEVRYDMQSLPFPKTQAESDFANKIDIFRQFARCTSILRRTDTASGGIPLVQTLCKELSDFRGKSDGTWSLEAELAVLGSQLMLYSFHLQAEATKSPSKTGSTSSQNIVVNLAMSVAIHVIHVFSRTPLFGDEDHLEFEKDSIRYLPKYYMGLLALAATSILRFMTLYPDASKHNEELGRNQIQVAFGLFGRCSMNENDEPRRLQKLIEALSKTGKQHLPYLKDPRGKGDNPVLDGTDAPGTRAVKNYQPGNDFDLAHNIDLEGSGETGNTAVSHMSEIGSFNATMGNYDLNQLGWEMEDQLNWNLPWNFEATLDWEQDS